MATIIQEIYESVNLVFNDRIVRNIAIFITIASLILPVFVSNFAAIFIYLSYILGFVVSWLLVKYQNKTDIYLQQLTSLYYEHLKAKKRVPNSCSICDDLSCKRHQKISSVTPWKQLLINKNLNSSLEQFYERIIENFITSWYKQFTDDTDFSNELRYCLRYSTATVINKFLELDVGKLISRKLLPCAVKHVDDYLYMKQIGKLKNAKFNDVVVEYLGKRLHAAVTNRKNELSYLQYLVSSILIHILPEDYLKCRNYNVVIREILAGWVLLPLMDVLADSNIINYLVILALTYKSKKHSKINVNEENVEFLFNFDHKDCDKMSSFATNLNKIKNNTDLLYAFMQFLKKQDHVNLLQFCLDVDDFNTKMLTPDLSKKQIEELHEDALRLYKEYLDKDSYNFISCPMDISLDFEYLVKEYYSIEKLTKSSKLLYKAYDSTFTTLETVWLSKFFHSSEFYAHICGSRIMPTYIKQLTSKQKKYESSGQGTVSKLSSSIGKIRGVLKVNNTVDGSFFPGENQCVDNGSVDDILLAECNPLIRDLNTWRVWISTFQTTTNKVVHFLVNVEKSNALSDDTRRNWVIWRKDQDFYTLKAKLVEFHGENEICDSPLPSRKAGSSVEARMTKYEDFLKKLLQKSTLRGSDLLYAFLTVEEDFTLYITTTASNIQDIGNIYQSMAYKLRKEKGQHLDYFMDAFLKSTGTIKNEKQEWTEICEALDPLNPTYNDKFMFPKTYRNHIFNDNFGIEHKSLKESTSGSLNPECFTECCFYLLRYVFNAPNGFLKLYASVCSIGGHLVDMIFKVVVEQKLKTCLSQSNLAYLIRQLEGVIFATHISPTKEELEARRKKAFELLDDAFPSLLTKILGGRNKTGFKTILEILQHPHYNKQLAYNLLDLILCEMYPMLNTKDEHYALT